MRYRRRKNRANQNISCGSNSTRPMLTAIFTAVAGFVINDLKKENSLIKNAVSGLLGSSSKAKPKKEEITSASYEVITEEEENK